MFTWSLVCLSETFLPATLIFYYSTKQNSTITWFLIVTLNVPQWLQARLRFSAHTDGSSNRAQPCPRQRLHRGYYLALSVTSLTHSLYLLLEGSSAVLFLAYFSTRKSRTIKRTKKRRKSYLHHVLKKFNQLSLLMYENVDELFGACLADFPLYTRDWIWKANSVNVMFCVLISYHFHIINNHWLLKKL